MKLKIKVHNFVNLSQARKFTLWREPLWCQVQFYLFLNGKLLFLSGEFRNYFVKIYREPKCFLSLRTALQVCWNSSCVTSQIASVSFLLHLSSFRVKLLFHYHYVLSYLYTLMLQVLSLLFASLNVPWLCLLQFFVSMAILIELKTEMNVLLFAECRMWLIL